MKFRLYRLPGSQRIWHIDTGPGTFVVNVYAFLSDIAVRSVDVGGNNVPRAWVEIEGHLFVDRNGVAKFMDKNATLIPAELEKIIQTSGCTLEVMDAAEKLSESDLSDEQLEKLTRPESKPI